MVFGDMSCFHFPVHTAQNLLNELHGVDLGVARLWERAVTIVGHLAADRGMIGVKLGTYLFDRLSHRIYRRYET